MRPHANLIMVSDCGIFFLNCYRKTLSFSETYICLVSTGSLFQLQCASLSESLSTFFLSSGIVFGPELASLVAGMFHSKVQLAMIKRVFRLLLSWLSI